MSRTWARWVALLSRKEHGRALAVVRMAFGLCVLYTVGSVVFNGLVPVLWLDARWGGYLHIEHSWWLVDALGGARPEVVWGLIAVTLLAGATLTLGFWTRLSAFVSLQGVLALTWINAQAGGSYDDLLTNALWLLVLADSGRTLSLDCRIRTGALRSDDPVSAWPRYLFIFQIVVVYFSTALQKISAYWTPGGDFSALYYILQQPTWQRWDMRDAAYIFPVTQVATASTWFWEMSSPLLLLAFRYRDTRLAPGRLRALFNRIDFRFCYILFGVGLHLGIFALMEVGPFSWITLSYYLAMVHPEEWGALARRRARARASRREKTALQRA